MTDVHSKRASHCKSLDDSECQSHTAENEVWDRDVHWRLSSLPWPLSHCHTCSNRP